MVGGALHAYERVLATAAILLLLGAAPGARAGRIDGSEVRRRGGCSGPSSWRLRVRDETGDVLRVRLTVEGGRPNQRWHVFMSDNGDGFYYGRRVSGAGGRFTVRSETEDLAGDDTIRATANNHVTGETCRARATL
jgi:hypothetical protein